MAIIGNSLHAQAGLPKCPFLPAGDPGLLQIWARGIRPQQIRGSLGLGPRCPHLILIGTALLALHSTRSWPTNRHTDRTCHNGNSRPHLMLSTVMLTYKKVLQLHCKSSRGLLLPSPDGGVRHSPLKLAFCLADQHWQILHLNQLKACLETFTYAVEAGVFSAFLCCPAADPVLLW